MKESEMLIPGLRQVRQLIADDAAGQIIIAKDADDFIIDELLMLTSGKPVTVDWIESKRALGKLCGLRIGAAVAALVKKS